MLSTEQKISEIHAILKKQESRRRWQIFFSWAWRGMILGVIVLMVWYPDKVIDGAYRISAPLLEKTLDTFLEKQSERFQDARGAMIDSVRGMFGTGTNK